MTRLRSSKDCHLVGGKPIRASLSYCYWSLPLAAVTPELGCPGKEMFQVRGYCVKKKKNVSRLISLRRCTCSVTFAFNSFKWIRTPTDGNNGLSLLLGLTFSAILDVFKVSILLYSASTKDVSISSRCWRLSADRMVRESWRTKACWTVNDCKLSNCLCRV